jgi:hypothetical protein
VTQTPSARIIALYFLLYVPILLVSAVTAQDSIGNSGQHLTQSSSSNTPSHLASAGSAFIAVIPSRGQRVTVILYCDTSRLGRIRKKSAALFPVPVGKHYITIKSKKHFYITSVSFNENDTVFFTIVTMGSSVQKLHQLDKTAFYRVASESGKALIRRKVVDTPCLNQNDFTRLRCYEESGQNRVMVQRPFHGVGCRFNLGYSNKFKAFHGGMNFATAFYLKIAQNVSFGLQADWHSFSHVASIDATPIQGSSHADMKVSNYEFLVYIRASPKKDFTLLFIEPGWGYYHGTGSGAIRDENGSVLTHYPYILDDSQVLLSLETGVHVKGLDLRIGYKKALFSYSWYTIGIGYDLLFKRNISPCELQ